MEDRNRKGSKSPEWLKTLWADLKSLSKELPPALLFAALIAGTVFIASQPATAIDQPWPQFQVLQRSILVIIRSTAFRSIAAPLIVLAIYGGLYYVFSVRDRRFIVVSDFRVWGSLKKKTPAKGVAGRLQDELMRLLTEMRSPESGSPAERAREGAASRSLAHSSKPQARIKPELSGGFVPETQVTLQYEGISLEGLHTFFRRKTGREVVITGDLSSHPNGFLIVARTKDRGPWEVRINSLDALSLGIGLEKLAIRILADLANGFFRRNANNFVFLQRKAHEFKEYDLVVRLAGLALQAAPRKYEQVAIGNLAKAYYSRAYWHEQESRTAEAIADLNEALKQDPSLPDALEMLRQLNDDVQNSNTKDRTTAGNAPTS